MLSTYVAFSCVGLTMYVFHKEITWCHADVEAKNGLLAIVTEEKNQIQEQLALVSPDIAASGQLETLNANVVTLMEEKEKIQGELTANTALLEEAHATITALQTELEAIKGATGITVEIVSESTLDAESTLAAVA